MNSALDADFFALVRKDLFGGKLTQVIVDNLNDLHGACLAAGITDQRQQAYVMATTYHETAHTMEPIDEIGKGRGRKYGAPVGPYKKVYYGRGATQLTWYDNYLRFEKLLGVPLTRCPELANDPEISARVITLGMAKGLFTGVGLNRFINAKICNFTKARKIINGTDKADLIAGYAETFLKALTCGH